MELHFNLVLISFGKQSLTVAFELNEIFRPKLLLYSIRDQKLNDELKESQEKKEREKNSEENKTFVSIEW